MLVLMLFIFAFLAALSAEKGTSNPKSKSNSGYPEVEPVKSF